MIMSLPNNKTMTQILVKKNKTTQLTFTTLSEDLVKTTHHTFSTFTTIALDCGKLVCQEVIKGLKSKTLLFTLCKANIFCYHSENRNAE